MIFMACYMFRVNKIDSIFKGDRLPIDIDGISLDAPFAFIVFVEDFHLYIPKIVSILMSECFSECLDYEIKKENDLRKKKEEELKVILDNKKI